MSRTILRILRRTESVQGLLCRCHGRLRQANAFPEESDTRRPVPDAAPGSMYPFDYSGMPRLRNTVFPAPKQSRAGGKNDDGAGLRVEGSGVQPSGFKRVMPALMHFFSVFHRLHGTTTGVSEPDPTPLIHLFLLRRQFRSAYPHLLLA